MREPFVPEVFPAEVLLYGATKYASHAFVDYE